MDEQQARPVTNPSERPAQPDDEAERRRRQRASDDFLVPGPTPTSNEGLARWGLTWLAFSLLLILVMFLITVSCFGFARLVGIA